MQSKASTLNAALEKVNEVAALIQYIEKRQADAGKRKKREQTMTQQRGATQITSMTDGFRAAGRTTVFKRPEGSEARITAGHGLLGVPVPSKKPRSGPHLMYKNIFSTYHSHSYLFYFKF